MNAINYDTEKQNRYIRIYSAKIRSEQKRIRINAVYSIYDYLSVCVCEIRFYITVFKRIMRFSRCINNTLSL